MIKLGSRVQETITGLRGIVIARTEYLYRTPEVAVQSREIIEGKTLPVEWFDESRVDIVSENKKSGFE